MREVRTELSNKLVGPMTLEEEMSSQEVELLEAVLPGLVELIQSGEMGRMIDYTGNHFIVHLTEKEKRYLKSVIAQRMMVEERMVMEMTQ